MMKVEVSFTSLMNATRYPKFGDSCHNLTPLFEVMAPEPDYHVWQYKPYRSIFMVQHA